jgi:hypothetical protein
VTVLPGTVNDFVVNMFDPQVNGASFAAPATVTARDVDLNIKTDFDASGNNVTITSSGTGTVFRGVLAAVLDQGTDFVNGVADLGSLGINYQTANAPELAVTFTATSAGPVAAGLSGAVDINPSSVIGSINVTLPAAPVNVSADVASQVVTAAVFDIGGSPVPDLTTVFWQYRVTVGAGTGAFLSAGTSTTFGGSASITLNTSTAAGDAFEVDAGDSGFGVIATSPSITVVAGTTVASFDVVIQSPQTNRVAFVGGAGTSTVTARDTFNNVITNYNTIPLESVTIAPSVGLIVGGTNPIPAANFVI